MNNKTQLIISGDEGEVDRRILEEAFQVFCEKTGLSSNVSVSLVFCSSDEMKELNRKYRGDDKDTDVISFPAEFQPGFFKENEAGEIFLGEILIDTNYIMTHTSTDDINKEVVPVFIHGLLHLLGYDHLNTKEKGEMQILEIAIKELMERKLK